MEWYLAPFKKYAQFSGRARRKEYWTFALINSAIAGILNMLSLNVSSVFGILGGVFALAIFIPSLAVAVRRLHDIGKTGTWYLIVLVPIVGWIMLFVFMLRDSNFGDNQFGPNPKGEGGPNEAAPQ